jgi:pimeloyl-ACP methyl ester carboxylesterase
MDRRRFLQLGAGAATLGGCAAFSSRYRNARIVEAAGLPANAKPIDAAKFHAMRQFAKTDFGRIAYVERGSGKTALFLHGFPLNGFQWRGALERLSTHRRCIAADFMALGYSEVAQGQSVAPSAQADMIATLLDSLSVSSVDVVANDSGGAIAQIFMTKHPDRVRTLLLTNCDTEPDCPPQAVLPVIELARAGTFVDTWLVPWVKDKTLARSAKGLGGMTYMEPTHPTDEAIDCYLGPLVSSPERKALTNAYAVALLPNPLAGIEPALKRSKVPTRILWGTEDNIFSQASADYLDKTLGNSRGVRRVPGAKLFFPEEMPDLIAEEAKRLWNV